jgi:hypothetical protein
MNNVSRDVGRIDCLCMYAFVLFLSLFGLVPDSVVIVCVEY